MTEFQPMFINFAASLSSPSFDISFAAAHKGNKPFLLLKVSLNYNWSSPAKQWVEGYYDYSSQTRVAPVWAGSTSPWAKMSYSGEFFHKSSPQLPSISAPKFCPNCGQPLTAGAKFCPGCGTALALPDVSNSEPLGDFPIQLSDLSIDELIGKQRGKQLAETIVSLFFSDNTPDERSLLLAFLTEEFVDAKTVSVINGAKTTSKCTINLADAQKIQVAVQAGTKLNTIQSKFAELLLRKAPLSLGYWGAIKALLKHQPNEVSQEAIGACFARLSASGQRRLSWWNTRDEIEDLRILDQLQTVPLARTRYYLSRLERRTMVNLSAVKPEAYVSAAIGFLLEAGRGSSSIDYVYAQIIYGSSHYLANDSRQVKDNLRNQEIAPFAPHVWANAQTELGRLWLGVSSSREIQDFVFTVAKLNKITLPPLDGYAVNLALSSSIAELRAMVCLQVAIDPSSWPHLTESGWGTFLRETDVKQLGKLRSSLVELESTYSLIGAIKLVVQEISNPRDEKMQLLAAMYFTLEPEYRYWSRDVELEGKIAAALVLSGISIPLDGFDLLGNRLGLNGLLACWAFMQELGVIDGTQKKLFEESALNYWSDQDLPSRQRTLQNLATETPELYGELGSLFISNAYDYELVQTFIRNLDELKETPSFITGSIVALLAVVPSEDINNALKEIFEVEVIADSISYFDILNSTLSARILAWSQISADPQSVLATALLSNKQLVDSTFMELNKSLIAQASGQQIEILCSYFTKTKFEKEIPIEYLVGACSNPHAALAHLGNKLVKKRGLQQQLWLELAETQMPLAVGFARDYLRGLQQEELSSQLLLAADSPVIPVRDLALELLDTLRDKIDIPFIYSRLAESPDPIIRGRVAEEALFSPWSDGNDLVAFDSELLVTLRRTRNARENVMARFDNEVLHLSDSSFVAPERIAALISLTRIGNSRDREWALSRLAQLKQAGHEIGAVSLNFVSGGKQNV